jgi:hypothetical protein
MNLAFRVAIFLTLLSAPALADSNLLTGSWVDSGSRSSHGGHVWRKDFMREVNPGYRSGGKRWQESRPEFEEPSFVRVGIRQRF